jgi:hypothetical protein
MAGGEGGGEEGQWQNLAGTDCVGRNPTDRGRLQDVCGLCVTYVVGDKQQQGHPVLFAESKKNVKATKRLTTADGKKLQKRHLVENLFCRLNE